MFSLSGAAISWQARKQSCISLSSTEAEYVAITDASKEAVYLQGLLNAAFHNRTKHIEVRYHYVRDLIENKKIEAKFLSSADMCADMFTKSLTRQKHELHYINIGLS
ncbi:hypothetical protein ILUMI_14535 [Ignelater luminosus]|uniref:Retrovirus-related Pol polyprotein from transposon TNT 1-94 n=1 Tax=Ignelater luminosus TaxID=2038154 RepID=A0A8K0CQ96_IGNLU|nr:hypothetical protein ILUMI_14535 [Ignelater luminosus]